MKSFQPLCGGSRGRKRDSPSERFRNAVQSRLALKTCPTSNLPGVGLEPTTPSLPFLVAGLRVLAAVRDFRFLAGESQVARPILLRLFRMLCCPIRCPPDRSKASHQHARHTFLTRRNILSRSQLERRDHAARSGLPSRHERLRGPKPLGLPISDRWSWFETHPARRVSYRGGRTRPV
jgi:hypothetical protein